LTVTATPAALWQAWTDVARFPSWDPREEEARLEGAFAVGATVWSKQRGNPGGAVTLTAVVPERLWRAEKPLPGGKLVIEVSDTGIGIPADAFSRIFSPFEQGDSSIHARYGGLGLGLSIARTLVKAHGGSLEVESEGRGQGARFTARFQIEGSVSVKTIPADIPIDAKSDASAPSANGSRDHTETFSNNGDIESDQPNHSVT